MNIDPSVMFGKCFPFSFSFTRLRLQINYLCRDLSSQHDNDTTTTTTTTTTTNNNNTTTNNNNRISLFLYEIKQLQTLLFK